MTYYTLTLDALATSTLDELATMEMGRPPIVVPWHLNWVFCREKQDDETAESAQEIECAELWIHTN